MRKKTGRVDNDSQDISLPQEEEIFEEFNEGNTKRLDPTYHERLIEFLARSSLEIKDGHFYLYKYENYLSGEQKSLVDKFVETEPPDENEVGLRYGSGRYLLVLLVPPEGKREKIVRSYRFRCHPVYDDRRADLLGPGRGRPSYQVEQAPPRRDTSLADAFALFQGMIQTIIPLVRPPENPDVQRMMSQNFHVVSDVMKKQLESNVQLMADYQRRVANLKQIGENMGKGERQQQDEEDSGVMAIIQQVAPLLQEWLPRLLKPGAEGKVVSNIVKETAMFQEIKRSRKMINALIGHLDQTEGQEKTNKILNALNLKRMMHQKK